jgi:hypothetical protein
MHPVKNEPVVITATPPVEDAVWKFLDANVTEQ